MPTMNSAYTVLKSTFGSSTSFWFLYDSNSSEVNIPVADFPLFTLECRIQAKLGIWTEVGNGFANFLIHLHSNNIQFQKNFETKFGQLQTLI